MRGKDLSGVQESERGKLDGNESSKGSRRREKMGKKGEEGGGRDSRAHFQQPLSYPHSYDQLRQSLLTQSFFSLLPK